jgi:predicted enzyme related to lactoylglutathione lyase
MTVRVECLCLDSRDPARVSSFWEAALGWHRSVDEIDEVVVVPPEGSDGGGAVPYLLFLQVPEDKTIKNRLHLDLRPDDQEAEVRRLIDLGARRVSVGQGPDVSWVVLADPDGNEFCVLKALSQ